MPWPISSVEVAALAISYSLWSPMSLTIFFITNSAIGLRHILPWQTKSIFCFMLQR